MTLDELIKWAWENPELVRGEKFYAQGKSNETYVYFHLYDGRKCILREYISADDTFEVEYEEEITEETVIPKLVKCTKTEKCPFTMTIRLSVLCFIPLKHTIS